MERLDCVVKSDMKELLFDEETIKNRVEELGKEITKHYENDEARCSWNFKGFYFVFCRFD